MAFAASVTRGAEVFHTSELIFPLENWHNHASCIVECPNGDCLSIGSTGRANVS